MATSLIMFLHLPISPQALAQTGLNATTAPRLDQNTACTDNEITIPDIEIGLKHRKCWNNIMAGKSPKYIKSYSFQFRKY